MNFNRNNINKLISNIMKLRHFAFAALASVMAFAACEQEVDPVNPDNTPEIYTVKLNCTGEIDVNQVPLTRFTPDENDLYGIQVYYKPVSGNNSYKKYAYGLFDDLTNVTIDLIADYKFKFCVDVVDDGKTKVYSDGIEIEAVNYTGYGYPFKAYNNYEGTRNLSITKVSNEFIYSEDCYFDNLGSSFQVVGSTSQYWNPDGVETYYGEAEIIPTYDGEQLSIFLKRMVFGIKVVADDFLTEGIVSVGFDWSYTPKVYMNSFTLTPDNKSVEKIYTNCHRNYWYPVEELADATEWGYINLSWTKDDGTVLTLKPQQVFFNRLKQTIINVTFYEDTAIEDAQLAVEFEDQLFVEEGQYTYSFGDDQSEYKF